MLISVTKRDIAKARRYKRYIGRSLVPPRTGDAFGVGRCCPITRAINRRVAESVGVSIHTVSLIRRGASDRVIKLPVRASHFVIRFDHGLSVRPFRFVLEGI